MDCKSVTIPLAANEMFRKDDGEKKVNSSLFRSLIGSLRYLTSTMPDIIDWAGSIDDMKSTSDYVFLFGSRIYSWLSKKQSVVAQSTAKTEYVSASKATSQAIWLRRIFEDIGEKQKKGLFCIVITNKQLQLPRIQSAMKDQSIFPSSIILSEKHKRKTVFSCIVVRQENNLLTSSPKQFLEKIFSIFENALELSSKCIEGECWN
ncbi:uncharacterized mitochondrial protein AtMg00810-like [Solanum lycopersicum]|uniref:uncharacterized mitochondrial protein AtMg00810-like n=1 Tax=Solanum lycopersicum TaxID=4081 RepID=UPI0037488B2D